MSTPVRTGLGPTIASWHLRAAIAVPVLLMLLIAVIAVPMPIWLMAALVAAATATVGNPRSHAATVLIGIVLVVVLGAAEPGWWLPLLVFGAHATHVGASLAAAIPVTADIEIEALRPSVRRFAVVQAAAQVIVLLVLVLTL